MYRRIFFICVTFLFLQGFSVLIYSEENILDEEISEEDWAIIENWEILENLDFLEGDLDTLEELGEEDYED